MAQAESVPEQLASAVHENFEGTDADPEHRGCICVCSWHSLADVIQDPLDRFEPSIELVKVLA